MRKFSKLIEIISMAFECKVCGEADPRAFHTYEGECIDENLCISCAIDGWEASRPEHEQVRREELDSQGYYDNVQ